MRTLITGGAGCIGSDLAEALVQQGHEVLVYDNMRSGRIEHISPLLAAPNFRLVEADVLDRDALNFHMRGVDVVWHLAANPDIRFALGDSTDKDLTQNTLGTYYVLEAMRLCGVKTLAFSSTSAVYGLPERLPIAETHPCRPISLYGASKLACEGLISAFQHLFDWRCSIFRFANIVGQKTRKKGPTVISDFVRKLCDDPRRLLILGDGKQAKSYLLSGECVNAMLLVTEKAPEPLAIYNIGSNDSVTVDRIADLVVETMGLSNVIFEYTGTEGGWLGDVPRFILDPVRINQLGWRARHTSEQAVGIAIRTTVESWRQNLESQKSLCRQ